MTIPDIFLNYNPWGLASYAIIWFLLSTISYSQVLLLPEQVSSQLHHLHCPPSRTQKGLRHTSLPVSFAIKQEEILVFAFARVVLEAMDRASREHRRSCLGQSASVLSLDEKTCLL